MKYLEARDNLRELLRGLVGKEFIESELDDIEDAAIQVRLSRYALPDPAEATASAVVLGCPGAVEEASAIIEEMGRKRTGDVNVRDFAAS